MRWNLNALLLLLLLAPPPAVLLPRDRTKTWPDSVQMMSEPSEPIATSCVNLLQQGSWAGEEKLQTFTALNCFLNAHTL